jgi:hypothetical protein
MGIIDYVRSKATPPNDIKPIEHIPSTMPEINLSLTSVSVCYLNDLLRLHQKYYGKISPEALRNIYEVAAKLMGVPADCFNVGYAIPVNHPIIQGEKTREQLVFEREQLVLEYEELLTRITALGKLGIGGEYTPEIEEEIANLIKQATEVKLQLIGMDDGIVEKQHENVTPEGVIDLDTVTEMY